MVKFDGSVLFFLSQKSHGMFLTKQYSNLTITPRSHVCNPKPNCLN